MLKRFAIFALLGPALTYLVIALIAVATTLAWDPAQGSDMVAQFGRIAAGWFSFGHVVIYAMASIPCGIASFPSQAAGRGGSITKRVVAAMVALALMCMPPAVLAYIVFPWSVFPIATLIAGAVACAACWRLARGRDAGTSDRIADSHPSPSGLSDERLRFGLRRDRSPS